MVEMMPQARRLKFSELDADIDPQIAESEIAFDLLEAVVRSVTAVMLDAVPAEGPRIVTLLHTEIVAAARQIEAARPDWSQLGIVAGAERRVCAILEELGDEQKPLA
ncbi:hypothetical protein [Methylobacterium radiodurans]|uniref:Uncharacterized protein n=1 Tax=Methylobacterium radiodurans TaxID=2202828 RepID=A0A2U8VPY1_9HYPH|nr:hypothetical protein [Methylobacterium radiodurans]AWN35704.1 hypothetical protein DK427_08065 [Methylobacterium radiodurans]